jgi:hypothetical protein
VKTLAASLVVLALAIALQAQSPSPGGYRARPTIVINPKDYLAKPTPSPRPRRRPVPPARRHPLSGPTPHVFEHYDTAPSR